MTCYSIKIQLPSAILFLACSLAQPFHLHAAPFSQDNESEEFLNLVLKDDADAIQVYLSAQPLPKLGNISLFKTAVYRGNTRIVEAFIHAGADLNEPGLICAALKNPSLTKLLLDYHVNAQGAVCDGLTPLQLASKRGYQDTVKLLLAGASDTVAIAPSSSEGLYEAAMNGNIAIMKLLLENGGTLSAKELMEVTRRNCMGGNLAALQLLKEKGIVPDYDRCYLYLSWVEKPYPELLEWLQSQHKISEFEIDGQPLINAAATRGNMMMARFLIDAGSRLDLRDAHYKYTALGAALTPENVSRPLRLEMAELLLSKGANPNLPEGRNERALLQELLHVTGCPVDERSYQAIWGPRMKAMELLIRHGADVNLADRAGSTPLHLAAATPNPDMIKLLLAHGAKVNAVNRGGYTPLYFLAAGGAACRDDKKIEQAVDTLVSNGADTTRDVNGKKLAELIDTRYPGGSTLKRIMVRLSAEQQLIDKRKPAY